LEVLDAWAVKIAEEVAPDEVDLAPVMAHTFVSGGKDKEELFRRQGGPVQGAFGPEFATAIFPGILLAIQQFGPELQETYGYWKGSATELNEQLPSSAKPETPSVLSKKVGQLAERTPALSVKHGNLGNSRAITLTLKNGVGSVSSNDDCECSGRGCLGCLTQELPFDSD
jgi:hypothetical protein